MESTSAPTPMAAMGPAGVTVFCGVPTLYAGMLAHPSLPARGQLGSDLARLRDSGALEFVSGVMYCFALSPPFSMLASHIRAGRSWLRFRVSFGPSPKSMKPAWRRYTQDGPFESMSRLIPTRHSRARSRRSPT